MTDSASTITSVNADGNSAITLLIPGPTQHKHNHNIHGGRYQDLKTGRYYDIWVCACGDEKIVYV